MCRILNISNSQSTLSIGYARQPDIGQNYVEISGKDCISFG